MRFGSVYKYTKKLKTGDRYFIPVIVVFDNQWSKVSTYCGAVLGFVYQNKKIKFDGIEELHLFDRHAVKSDYSTIPHKYLSYMVKYIFSDEFTKRVNGFDRVIVTNSRYIE
jgi:hypothetical protein